MKKITIVLPARLEDDLRWEPLVLMAQEAIKEGRSIFWEFDFGLDETKICVNNEATFHTFCLAIDHFSKTLWKEFAHVSCGVILYRGDLSFVDRWLFEDKTLLFCVTVFAQYLHRLASYLHEDAQPFCFFRPSLKSTARTAQLFSKERFPYLHVVIEESPQDQEAPLGVVLPRDDYCSEAVLDKLDRLFAELQERSLTFRILSEVYLTEDWQGLDTLIFIEEALSPYGKRALQGFCASGGTQISWDKIDLLRK